MPISAETNFHHSPLGITLFSHGFHINFCNVNRAVTSAERQREALTRSKHSPSRRTWQRCLEKKRVVRLVLSLPVCVALTHRGFRSSWSCSAFVRHKNTQQMHQDVFLYGAN